MKKITHQREESDESSDQFCRDLLMAAQASEQEVNAAINAPFLYQRVLARIAAEQAPQTVVFGEREKILRWGRGFLFGDWSWRWRLAMPVAAVVLIVLAGWYGLHSSAPVPLVVQQQINQLAPTITTTPSPLPELPGQINLPSPQVVRIKSSVKAKFTAPAKSRREKYATLDDNTEIATDYLPLTYVANSEERSGQVVRVEMPRSAMLALGLPLNNEPIGKVVKADVIVGDDGLALAIRFVR